MIKTHWHAQELCYDGRQLASLFAYKNFGLQGSSLVAFQGPCQVKTDNLVDQEDVLAGACIFSQRMLHFIGENFPPDMEKMVLRQRLLVEIARETVAEACGEWLRREGDDLYRGDRKLSVSIATVSPVSSLLHLGLNIISEGAPVPAIGLAELGVKDAEAFAALVLQRYAEEMQSVEMACCKVRGVT